MNRCPTTTSPAAKQPLYEHLQRSLHYTLDRLGPHELPLIGRADWNDCLNLNCFSDRAGPILPDHHQQGRQSGRIGLHRRVVRPGGPGNGSPGAAAGTARADMLTALETAADMEDTGLAARLGWRLVPPRL